MEKYICTIDELKEFTDFSTKEERNLRQIIKRHPMRITPYYLSLIDWADPCDPIKKMAIPSLEELNLQGSYDASGESENTKMIGLQHKYKETALILASNKCAVYCRHCFRKRLVGLNTQEIIERFEDAASYIKQHPSINNILISGGDPLVLKNEIIEHILSILSEMPQLKFIRFGTRTPVTFPSRFEDDNLVQILSKYSYQNRRIHIITQFNHPKEITKQSIKAVDSLIKAGVVVNNQTVLLKGINDDPKILTILVNKLVGIGVNPYYIFQCRPVKRVKHHFQVSLHKGIEIIEKVKANCNGLSKQFRYIMSHRSGKIEIIGELNNEIYFKYHQAKNRKNFGKIFKRPIDDYAGWLDDFKDIDSPTKKPSIFHNDVGILVSDAIREV